MSSANLRATCPHCHARIRISRPELIGSLVKCPGCSQSFRIEIPQRESSPAEPPEEAETTSEETYSLQRSTKTPPISLETTAEPEDEVEDLEYVDDGEVDSDDAALDEDDFNAEGDDDLEDVYEDEPTDRKRRTQKTVASADTDQARSTSSRTGELAAKVSVGCALIAFLTSVALPTNSPEITRYGTLPTDAPVSELAGPVNHKKLAQGSFEGSESDLLSVMDAIIAKKSTLPRGTQQEIVARAMKDDRVEVLLRTTTFWNYEFSAKMASHPNDRVAQAALRNMLQLEPHLRANILLNAYEHAITQGREPKLIRDALLGLPDEEWQSGAKNAKTDIAFEFYGQHGGLRALLELLALKDQSLDAAKPRTSPALTAAIESIWKRVLVLAQEGEVRIDGNDVQLGRAGKGLTTTQLLKLDVPPEFRKPFALAIETWASPVNINAFIHLSAKLGSRSMTEVVSGLAIDNGKIPQKWFQQLSKVTHPQIGDAMIAAFLNKQWPSYSNADVDWALVAAQSITSSDQDVVVISAEILNGQVRPDGSAGDKRSIGPSIVGKLNEAAKTGERAQVTIDSIFRSSKDYLPLCPQAYLVSPLDAQKALALPQSWKTNEIVLGPEVAPILRALCLSPPSSTPGLSQWEMAQSTSILALAAILRVDSACRDDVLTIARGLLGAADVRTRAAVGDLLLTAGEPSDVILVMRGLTDARLRPLVSQALQGWRTENHQALLVEMLQGSQDDGLSLAILQILSVRGTVDSLDVVKKFANGNPAVAKAADRAIELIENRKNYPPARSETAPFFNALLNYIRRRDAVEEGDLAKAITALETEDALLQSQTLAWMKRKDFGVAGHPEVAAACLKLIDSPNIAVACFATVTYAKSAGPAAIPKLVEQLKTGKPFRAEAAAEALSEIDSESALSPLVELLRHHETRSLGRAALRRQAARNLDPVIAAVQPLIADSDFGLATAAGFVIAEVGRPEDVKLLEQILQKHPYLLSFVAEMQAAPSQRPKASSQ